MSVYIDPYTKVPPTITAQKILTAWYIKNKKNPQYIKKPMYLKTWNAIFRMYINNAKITMHSTDVDSSAHHVSCIKIRMRV